MSADDPNANLDDSSNLVQSVLKNDYLAIDPMFRQSLVGVLHKHQLIA